MVGGIWSKPKTDVNDVLMRWHGTMVVTRGSPAEPNQRTLHFYHKLLAVGITRFRARRTLDGM